ncbi:MAG: patatin-like phospholipase family protein [Lewinella sp.]|nr:patatin-like phospholipase family protein [Lewinella sp.]
METQKEQPQEGNEKIEYPKVIAGEDVLLRKRREKLFGIDYADRLSENRFGIALSGGGIRSATINLGLLKTLNKYNILEHADYISTVSGGGYTGAYIQATLKETGAYEELFNDEHITYMRMRGEYLFPGTGWLKLWNQFVLVISYIISLIMSWISPGILIVLAMGLYAMVDDNFITFDKEAISAGTDQLFQYSAVALAVIFLVHYIFNIALNFNLYVSAYFNIAEAVLVGLVFLTVVTVVLINFSSLRVPHIPDFAQKLVIGVLLILLGFFANPNASSFHRFYRKQLADAFMKFSGTNRNVLLKDLCQVDSAQQADFLAPYPLINTCLNLQSSSDPNFQGTKASDYFLLSPLYAGAKLTGYVHTAENYGYNTMTLPAAVTISAAAVNPGMGIYSNKVLSILTTILNLRLGYWTWNPSWLKTTRPIVFWPFYFIYELFSRIGTDKKMVNISDGGHIENLAVIELLRRKCRLILAIDAGADPNFTFADLENLTIRARNELGVDIRFRPGQIPEEIMRPHPSHGYSLQRYAIADLYQLWDKVVKDGKEVIEHYKDKKIGTMVYIKSTVTAPEGRPDIPKTDFLKYGTYKYKIYHPLFPHEPTSDQFFDPIQWEAYYQLGQYMGADVLGLRRLDDRTKPNARVITPDELIRYFDEGEPLFLPIIPQVDEIPVSMDALEKSIRPRGVDVDERFTEEEEKVVEKDVEYKM